MASERNETAADIDSSANDEEPGNVDASTRQYSRQSLKNQVRNEAFDFPTLFVKKLHARQEEGIKRKENAGCFKQCTPLLPAPRKDSAHQVTSLIEA